MGYDLRVGGDHKTYLMTIRHLLWPETMPYDHKTCPLAIGHVLWQ